MNLNGDDGLVFSNKWRYNSLAASSITRCNYLNPSKHYFHHCKYLQMSNINKMILELISATIAFLGYIAFSFFMDLWSLIAYMHFNLNFIIRDL